MGNNNLIFSKVGVVVNVLVMLITFAFPMYKSIFHFLNYSDLLGLGPNTFGHPKNYSEVMFNACISIVSLIVLIGLVRYSKTSWIALNILGLFEILMLILQEIELVSKYIGYFEIKYLFYVIFLAWVLYFFSRKEIKRFYGIDQNYWITFFCGVAVLFTLWFFSYS